MLSSIKSSSPSFKTLTFKKGLNIVVAERAADAEESAASLQRRTRNGAGKSSIIDIVHFVLGGRPEGALKSPAVEDSSFKLEIDIGDDRCQVTRTLWQPKFIEIAGSTHVPNGAIPVNEFNELLGHIWFNLPEERRAGSASFRQLFAYFARRRRDGGIDSPTSTFRSQSNAVIETNLAVLFNLDSEVVRKFHQTRSALKQIEAARKALRDLETSQAGEKTAADVGAELAAKKASVEMHRDRLSKRVEQFNVLPAFRDLERELASLNAEARGLSDADVLDEELINASRQAAASEEPPAIPALKTLFGEAGVIFPEVVTRRYEEVFRFHQRLVENRLAHLNAEIASAERRIAARQKRRVEIESRRRAIVISLRGGGPADELLRLRDELSSIEGEIRGLQGRLDEAQKLDLRYEELQSDLNERARALRQDRREREEIVNEASRTFAAVSEQLYQSAGQLVVSATDAGLKIIPSAPADQSAGVMNMEIFCFDMTVASLCHRRGLGPGFLLHDSHLFEPVDGRQFARALRLGSEIALDNDFQYIVTLNSDELDRAEREGLENFSEFVLPTRLSDTADGGLFGFRFD